MASPNCALCLDTGHELTSVEMATRDRSAFGSEPCSNGCSPYPEPRMGRDYFMYAMGALSSAFAFIGLGFVF